MEEKRSKRPCSRNDSHSVQRSLAPATGSIGIHEILNQPAEGDGEPGSRPASASPRRRASPSHQGSALTGIYQQPSPTVSLPTDTGKRQQPATNALLSIYSSYILPRPPSVLGPFAPMFSTAPFGEFHPYGRIDHSSSAPGAIGRAPWADSYNSRGLVIDYESGSRLRAEKRKANNDSSQRSRNRKKHVAVLEQRNAQLNEEIRQVTEERDFYRSERDFFREEFGREIGMNKLPARPPSPRHFQTRPQQATSETPAEHPAAEPGAGSTESSSEQVSTASPAAAAVSAPARATTLPQPQPTSTGTTRDQESYATSAGSSPDNDSDGQERK